MSQLQNTLPFKSLLSLIERILRRIIGKEIKTELRLFEIPLLDQGHAHDIAVKGKGLLGVFDSEHGMVEDVSFGIGRGGRGGGHVCRLMWEGC
jgi:hypothetical protein